MRLQIEWLQTFLVAAEEENFRKTAEHLHLAQPTVTQHIRKLETLWDVKLFHRVGQHVELSAAGRRFYRHAQQLVQAYTASLEDMARWRQGYTTRVIIAVSPLIATSYLPRWIQGFSGVRGDIEFVIQVMESQDVLHSIATHRSDIGLSRLQPQDAALNHTTLYDDEVVLVAPASSQNIDGPPLEASELLSQQVVFTHCHPQYWPALIAGLRSLQPNVRTMVVSQVHVAIQWIVDGLGISFLPKSAIRRELLRGTVEEVAFPFFPLPTARTHLVAAAQMSDAAKDFADYIRSYTSARQSL